MSAVVLHAVESLVHDAASPAVCLGGLFAALEPIGYESQVVSMHGGVADSVGFHWTKFEAESVDDLVRSASLVHLHGWGSEFSRRVASAAWRAGKPYIISPFGAMCDGPYQRRTWRDRVRAVLSENRMVRRSAAVTALNTPEKLALEAGGLRNVTAVLPLGVSVSGYADMNGKADISVIQDDRRCLLLLGPIHPAEGLVPFMKAFGEIGSDADGWTMVLAGRGEGDWRPMLEAAVRRKGAEDRVVFTDAADLSVQRSWLARASLLACPSLRFRPAVSMMQAVAAGVPVLVSDRAVPDGLSGAVSVHDLGRESIRETLRSLLRLSDQELVARGQDAREVGRAMFDWSIVVQQYVQLYNDVA